MTLRQAVVQVVVVVVELTGLFNKPLVLEHLAKVTVALQVSKMTAEVVAVERVLLA
jgi:hypothetical protein